MPPLKKIDGVNTGKDVQIADFVNLYGCSIGDFSKVGPFVEIQRGVVIGKNCKISSHTFICGGVAIEDGVFVGHGVMFINDKYPSATTADGRLEVTEDWRDRFLPTQICKRASIGSNATILGGVRIGEGALVGAGSVVTKDVPPFAVVAGNPAKVLRMLN